MLKLIHKILVNVSLTRKFQRRLTRTMKKAMGFHDPYGDLFYWAHRSGASAVLDIGAFQGETVMRFLDELAIPVHAFEPSPVSFSLLKTRFANKKQVHMHNIALGKEAGMQRLFVNNNQQTNSLLDNGEGNLLGFSDATHHVGQVEVEVATLDDWAERNRLEGQIIVKADVQGVEGLLIDGGERTIREHVVAFFSEVQIESMYEGQSDFSNIHDAMKKLGFALSETYPCMKDSDGRAVQFDCLWVKKEWLSKGT